ncbi:MAG: carbohydrate binding domain-containing protein [Paludibacteraceae bacterium]|nr:carbohydrate binding domain-containing protein [Paludibacteraceae bacterium]
MKKITLLLSFIACVAFTQAQTNLLVNPGFETWTNNVPDGWTIQAPDKGTVTGDATILNEGTKSLKIVTTGTFPMWQSVPVTAGKTYTLSMSYYIVSGDGSDARIWSNFKNGTAFLTADELGTELNSQLKGPDNLYFADERGSWKTYSLEFVAPSMATDFNFEFRTYTAATVYWDNMFFGEKTTGLNSAEADKFKAIVIGNELHIKNVANGAMVEIFSALGSKVQTSVLENGKVSVDDLSKGMYIVRVGKSTQKFMR